MKPRRIQLSLLVLALTGIFHSAGAQIKVGVNTGINFTNVMIQNETGEKENTQAKPGMHIGFTADIPVMNDLFIQPGIFYSRKGFKQKTGGFYGYAVNFKVKAEYVELPVTILYKPKLWGRHLFAGAGPYLALATGGSWNSDSDIIVGGDMIIGNRGDVIFRNDAVNGGNLESYTYGRPVDYGANFLIGYELLPKFSLQCNAQVGLANLQPAYNGIQPKGKIRNRNIGFSLGYTF